ncbi:MAG: tetratricopeptide repeat protein [Imperialibacter sp.]|uniref:tetratricopeptide repeat protein n=1 Tax=Imperialibacter sp. TaxID=2038411 RepID=UPI0032F07721
MGNERIENLLIFLKETPQDPFLLYALATEYRTDSPVKAKEYFDQLLEAHPDYLATYYQAAHLFWEMGLTEQAAATFENGINLAKTQKATKTLAELQNAYMNFQIEEGL